MIRPLWARKVNGPMGLFKDKNKQREDQQFRVPDSLKDDLLAIHKAEPAHVRLEANLPMKGHEEKPFLELLKIVQEGLELMSNTYMVNVDCRITPAKVREELFKRQGKPQRSIEIREEKGDEPNADKKD